MAEGPGFAAAWSRALEANARYYESIGQLTSSWLRELAEVSSGLRLPRVVSVGTQPAGPRLAVVPTPPRPEGKTAERPAQAATLVLEAEGGQQATGAFLVENTLSRPVAQAVEAGPFTDAAGRQTAFVLTLEPPVIELAAGDQVVVRATVVVPATLEGESRGTVRVAGVPGAEIPLVIRRQGQ